MGRRIVYSERFKREFDAQMRWIANERPQTAVRIAARAMSVIGLLEQHPELGRPGRVRGTRELVITGTPFIACYRFADDTVAMLLFRHGARRWPRRL